MKSIEADSKSGDESSDEEAAFVIDETGLEDSVVEHHGDGAEEGEVEEGEVSDKEEEEPVFKILDTSFSLPSTMLSPLKDDKAPQRRLSVDEIITLCQLPDLIAPFAEATTSEPCPKSPPKLNEPSTPQSPEQFLKAAAKRRVRKPKIVPTSPIQVSEPVASSPSESGPQALARRNPRSTSKAFKKPPTPSLPTPSTGTTQKKPAAKKNTKLSKMREGRF